jgi:hypothetical protein
MGTTYYGICHDCREFIDLDKFYGWNVVGAGREYADIDKEDLSRFNAGWVYRSLRLHFFLARHDGHRLSVRTEHAFEGWLAITEDKEKPWKEVAPWPQSHDEATETIDFSDPKAGRLFVKTVFGRRHLRGIQARPQASVAL